MKTRLAAAALLLAFAGAALAAETAPQQARIDELMARSGLDKQLKQIEPQIQAGAAAAREGARGKGPPQEMDDETYATLKRVMASVFAPDRMRREFVRRFDAELAVADQEQALVWLRSPLGRRLTALEEASGEPAEAERLEREALAFAATLPEARLARMNRLAAALKIGDSAAALLSHLTLAIVYGAVMTVPGADPEMLQPLRKRFEEQRPKAAKELELRYAAFFADVYRNVSDEDMDAYIGFSESEAGRRYHAASIVAFEEVFLRAALDMGRQMGESAAQPRRKS